MKFETMFRGHQVIIQYELYGKGKIDYAFITDDNPHFTHPDYESSTNELDDFHEEVWNLTKAHLLKVKKATLK